MYTEKLFKGATKAIDKYTAKVPINVEQNLFLTINGLNPIFFYKIVH